MQEKTHRAKRVLHAVSTRYPGAFDDLERFRRSRGRGELPDWPDWCYVPMAASWAIVSDGGMLAPDEVDDVAILAALGAWRMTQGIYRFDPTLAAEIIKTPLDGDVPWDHLLRLPEWCVYIETAGIDLHPEFDVDGLRIHGAWVHLEHDVNTDLPEIRMLLDTAVDPRNPFHPFDGLVPALLPIRGKSIEDSIRALAESGRKNAKKAGVANVIIDEEAIIAFTRSSLGGILNLALYLCSGPEMTPRPAPEKHQKHQARSPASRPAIPASAPTTWEVGTRIGAALRAAYQREQAERSAIPTGRHVRPHVRRAHWHTFVSGPRKREDGTEIPAAERRRDLRWLPPIPINIQDYETLPATIREVRG